MTDMRASFRDRYCSPGDVRVREIPRPTLGPKDVLVRVNFATVNRTGIALVTAKPFIMRLFTGLFRPRIPVTGTDFVGVIVEVGADVEGFSVGDRVAGFHDEGLGSHAEYVAVRADRAMFVVPEGVSDEAAVAGIEGGHYAYNFVNKVELRPGTRVMVNGGTGAIGSSAIQLLKNRGAEVVATCRGAHQAMVKDIGADEVIDYLKDDFTQQDTHFDFVLDAVGKSTFGQCKGLLVDGGTYISSELGPYCQNPLLALTTRLGGGKRVIFPIPSDTQGSLDALVPLLSKEAFRPLIDRTYALENIAEAFEYVAAGQKVGSVLVDLRS